MSYNLPTLVQKYHFNVTETLSGSVSELVRSSFTIMKLKKKYLDFITMLFLSASSSGPGMRSVNWGAACVYIMVFMYFALTFCKCSAFWRAKQPVWPLFKVSICTYTFLVRFAFTACLHGKVRLKYEFTTHQLLHMVEARVPLNLMS